MGWDIVWALKGTYAVSRDDPLVNIIWMLTLVFLSLAAVVTFALLSQLTVNPVQDRETRCRRCGYILRGITEPRCPE